MSHALGEHGEERMQRIQEAPKPPQRTRLREWEHYLANVGKWFLLVVGSLFAINGGMELISSADTWAVLGGLFLFVAILALWARVVYRFVRSHSPLWVLLLVVAGTGLGCTRVPPGTVGIKVNMLGSERGVQKYALTTGLVLYMPYVSQVFHYPVSVQTAMWSRQPHEGRNINDEISFNDKDGLAITADVSLSYHLIAEKVPDFYVKFRSDNLTTFTYGFLRNVARDAFNEVAASYSVEQIYGDRKEEYLHKVHERVNGKMEPYGVILDQFGFLVPPRPPDNVMRAINAKIQATQDAIKVENEVRQAKAEAQKAIATAEGDARSRTIRAEAEAKANQIVAASLTPTLVQYYAVQKWDGKRPMVEGQNTGLLLNLPLK